MLTAPQRQSLKTSVQADSVLSQLTPGPDNAYAIADAMNLIVSPAFIVWKTSVSIDEIMRNGMDWARVDNLSVGKARIWDWLGRLGTLNASRPNIRAGIDATWVGTAADLAVRATVYTHCKRSATRIEKLIATGTGTDVSPATSAYDDGFTITYQDVMQAMGW
jgi:hypothetical protein